MASVDFTSAQQRVDARQRARSFQNQERLHSQKHLNASNAVGRLPFPFGALGQRGQELWDRIKGREGTHPAFRVGQVDAELLDEELLFLLKSQVGEALKFLGSHFRDDFSPEILLVLRAILFKLSIWDHNASYGAVLQDLQYTDARHQGPIAATPSKWQKACYGILSVGGRYSWTKWEEWLLDQEGIHEEPRPAFHLLSRVSSLVATTHSIAAFTSFLVFLVDGRYRTLLDRLLRMRLAPPSTQTSRVVSFEYLNRQLVWHAFTEFLLFLLPLVGISRWRRWISRAWRNARNLIKKNSEESDQTSSGGELAFLPERTCAICYQELNPTPASENEIMATLGASGGVVGSALTDVTNPYETIPCACVYCFVCIATRLETEEGEGWTCLRCGEHIRECRPWAGGVLEAVDRRLKKKTVSFSDEDEVEKTHQEELSVAEVSDKVDKEQIGFHWTGEESDSGIDISTG